MSGTQDVVIAAGIESMTRVPMGLPRDDAQALGAGRDPWTPKLLNRFGIDGFSQFGSAQMVADKYGLSKADMDAFGLQSHQKAAAATRAGAFAEEILVVDGLDGEGNTVPHDNDEGIRYDATAESVASAKLLFEGGMLTAATSSQICDGASGVMVVNEKALKAHGLIRFGDDDDVVAKANDSRFGLGAYLHTRDLARAHLVAGQLQAGCVAVNGMLPMAPNQPFGGYKQSGLGREGARAGLEEFLQVRQVVVHL